MASLRNMKTVIGLGLLLGMAPAAWGQDALGSGNILDRNLSQTGGPVNAPVSQSNYGNRNLLVTGNVIGGRGFSESVGYSAPNDFRGDLGSNDLFAFRSNSAISNIQLISYGNTYQRFRLGQQLDMFEYRRTGSGSSIGDIVAPNATFGQISEIRANLDRISRASSSSKMMDRGVEASVVGNAVTYDQSGQIAGRYLINSSPVRGVFATTEQSFIQGIGLNSNDLAYMMEDRAEDGEVARSPGIVFQSRFVDLKREPGRVEAELQERRVDLSLEPEYRKILEGIASRAAKLDGSTTEADQGTEAFDTARLTQLDEDFERLRQELAGSPSADSQAPGGPSVPGSGEDSDPIGAGDVIPGTPRLPGRGSTEGDTAEGSDESESERLTPEELGRLLRHGMEVHELSSSEKDRLAKLLDTGEQYLREGEFFWAERTFERALLFAPEHPWALAGMVHSEIGAGLYLSASLTLRKLFTRHPEMIDIRYAEGLFPKYERLVEASDKLRRRLDTEPHLIASNGLLLAYMGHHLKDKAMIEEGLDLIEANAPDDPLTPLLRQVWLADRAEDDKSAEQATGGESADGESSDKPERTQKAEDPEK